MHSYLVVGKGDELDVKIKEIAHSHNAKSFHFDIQGISDVKELIKLTKLSFNMPTLVCIKNIHNVSEEGLNSLLKLIEEPGENLYFALTTDNYEKTLSTISSRCQIVHTGKSTSSYDKTKTGKFINSNKNHKFMFIDKVKSTQDALNFASELSLHLHSQLLKVPNSKAIQKNSSEALILIRSLQKNGNPTIHLTNFIISLI